ncbi:hypothetical protein OBBRIDRAFT_371904 [Obba rivulosa]|uniref:Uncharacterized protein n=1 Tax=Obba rivulosa TaxID=1052685 RepID=A0A8E2DP52_9APHY|nr:hypothetical protein OBBRIDRAFT_371904 [Obba rivulosa]
MEAAVVSHLPLRSSGTSNSLCLALKADSCESVALRGRCLYHDTDVSTLDPRSSHFPATCLLYLMLSPVLMRISRGPSCQTEVCQRLFCLLGLYLSVVMYLKNSSKRHRGMVRTSASMAFNDLPEVRLRPAAA